MKNNKITTPIIFMSVFIFSIFTYVSFTNIFSSNSSDSYFASENNKIDAKIENTIYEKGKLTVTISGNAKKGCIKSTKTDPKENSTCWVDISDYKFSTSVLKNKTYYIWLMDNNGIISNKYEYNQTNK